MKTKFYSVITFNVNNGHLVNEVVDFNGYFDAFCYTKNREAFRGKPISLLADGEKNALFPQCNVDGDEYETEITFSSATIVNTDLDINDVFRLACEGRAKHNPKIFNVVYSK